MTNLIIDKRWENKNMMADNKEIVNQLKESIEYVNVRVKFFVDCFGVEQNFLMDRNAKLFKFNQNVLYEFCNEFDCEFKYTSCNGSRPIFTFNDVDTTHAFIFD